MPLLAQINSVVTINTPPKTTVKRNQVVTTDLEIQLRNGFHVNSDKPNDPYLIPLKLTWAAPAIADASEVTYPKPVMEKLDFSTKPVSIFSGDFKTQTKFKIAANAPLGEQVITGKLRYQACNNRECLPPRTVEVKIPVEIRN
jgi:DsbC/DsbD-like thiol-disulfide interchange protein